MSETAVSMHFSTLVLIVPFHNVTDYFFLPHENCNELKLMSIKCFNLFDREQLLLVLLQITSLILSKTPPKRKEETLGGKLAPAIFQVRRHDDIGFIDDKMVVQLLLIFEPQI